MGGEWYTGWEIERHEPREGERIVQRGGSEEAGSGVKLFLLLCGVRVPTCRGNRSWSAGCGA